MTTRWTWGAALAAAAALIIGGLVYWQPWLGPPSLIVGSTTTTQDTGLLDVLQSEYGRQRGIPVRIVVAGTGAILQEARNGDLDVLLTHDRDRELAFVGDGQGLWRKPVMYNWFVFVGPSLPTWNSSVTGEGLARNATAFLALLYEHRDGIVFVSRGDGSGTNARELALWKAAAVNQSLLTGSWYKVTGSGQAESLRVAAELNAYTLTDEATWDRMASQGLTGNLQIVVRDPARMKNQYGVIPVNIAVHPKVYEHGALDFAAWITGAAGQAVIASFTVGGQQVFFPDSNDSAA